MLFDNSQPCIKFQKERHSYLSKICLIFLLTEILCGIIIFFTVLQFLFYCFQQIVRLKIRIT